MKLELDLLNNSYDYINSSLELYKVADEYGMHDEQKTKFENKVKWKLAFITMMQAIELLLKEVLFRIHENLIYENIDSENIHDGKTVTLIQSINRINNFKNNIIDAEKKSFLIRCSKTRNEFIHYKVKIQSEKIKQQYCIMYSIYNKLHKEFFHENIKFYSEKYKGYEKEIFMYNEKYAVFRGREVNKYELDEFKEEIKCNSKYKFYITNKGDKVERIKYGEENNYLPEERRGSIYSDFKICDDCFAKIGEYHLDGCDLEICPVCFNQLNSCNCIKVDNEGNFMKI